MEQHDRKARRKERTDGVLVEGEEIDKRGNDPHRKRKDEAMIATNKFRTTVHRKTTRTCPIVHKRQGLSNRSEPPTYRTAHMPMKSIESPLMPSRGLGRESGKAVLRRFSESLERQQSLYKSPLIRGAIGNQTGSESGDFDSSDPGVEKRSEKTISTVPAPSSSRVPEPTAIETLQGIQRHASAAIHAGKLRFRLLSVFTLQMSLKSRCWRPGPATLVKARNSLTATRNLYDSEHRNRFARAPKAADMLAFRIMLGTLL